MIDYALLNGVSTLFAQADDGIESSLKSLGQMPIWIMGGYLVLLLVLGIAGWLKSKVGEEDYYLAGRNQGWMISSVTIMATFFSSFALLGAPGMVYREGLMFALFSLNVPVAGVCVYLLGSRIWKVGRKFGYVTPGDMVADYYGSKFSLKMLVALASFLYVLPYVVMQINAGGLISDKLFENEHSFEIGASVLAAITMLYIMIGGMRSVAWTDLIQGTLLIVGMLVSGFAMFMVFNGPGEFFSRVSTEMPASSLTLPGTTGGWPWTLIFTVCVLGSSGSMVQPAQWMRFYSASSVKTLKRGAVIFAVVLTTCFILGVMLIGLAGQVLYPLHMTLSEEFEDDREAISLPDSLDAHTILKRPTTEDIAKVKTEAKLEWIWPVEGKREMTAAQRDALLAAGESTAYRAAVTSLYAKVGDASVDGKLAAHEKIGDYNSILIVVISKTLPETFGTLGAIVASLIIVSIMAASMSTADSNLHALSAVATRDIYDSYIEPGASENKRVWVGRIIIVAATGIALSAVIFGHDDKFKEKYDIISMIAKMGLMAIAFSAQLLPLTIDMLFLQKGTGKGAAAGLAVGLFGAFLFGPLFVMLVQALGDPAALTDVVTGLGKISKSIPMHGSVWGLMLNIPLFVIVSLFTSKPDPEKVREYREIFAA